MIRDCAIVNLARICFQCPKKQKEKRNKPKNKTANRNVVKL